MSTVCSSQVLDSTGAKVDADTRPYDVNFCFPVQDLEDESFKLTSFIPSVHAELFVIPSASDPDIYNYLPFGPFSSAECFTKQLIEGRIQPNPGCILFAILHKGKPSSISGSESDGLSLTGTIGLLNTDPTNLRTELGFIIVLPAFRGAPTFATSHAVHLLLTYCLDTLHFRRVEWRAHADNHRSIRAAQRAGFKLEAIMRWERVLKDGKIGNGKELRRGDQWDGEEGRERKGGRDTAVLALCWDDWDEMQVLSERSV